MDPAFFSLQGDLRSHSEQMGAVARSTPSQGPLPPPPLHGPLCGHLPALPTKPAAVPQ